MKNILILDPNGEPCVGQIASQQNSSGVTKFVNTFEDNSWTYENIFQRLQNDKYFDFVFLNWRNVSHKESTLDSRHVAHIIKTQSPETKVIFLSSVREMNEQMLYFGADICIDKSAEDAREEILSLLL
jgi:hypothetical protein